MWAEAILAKHDLEQVIRDFCPLRIALGEDGTVLLSDPHDLELVPEVGLRMSVAVEVHWPVLGTKIPVTARSAILELVPQILKRLDGDKLTFRFRLIEVDISTLPGIVDRGIVDLLNRELEAKHVELSWGFTKTLSHVFELPDVMISARAIDLRAAWGQVKITSEALVLAVSFRAGIEPREGGPKPILTTLAQVPPPVLRERHVPSQSLREPSRPPSPNLATLGWIGGAALLVGLGISAMLLGRQRWA
jgi:hypothetical protein